MQLKDVLDFIRLDAESEDIRIIEGAIRNRRSNEQADKLYALQVGDKVKFNHNTRPSYMVGAQATVTKINRTRVVVDLDRPCGRFNRNIRTAVSLIDKV